MFIKIKKFIDEVKIELKKVSWTPRNELLYSTAVVIVTVCLMAVFIGVVDFIISRFISLIIR